MTSAECIPADLDLLDLLETDHYRNNPSTRFYINKARNDRNRYRKLIDWAIADRAPTDSWHRITHGQLAAAVYGTEPTREEGVRKSKSNRRSLDRLASAGLIEWRAETTATGKFVCLAYRLLPVAALSSPEPRRSSSAGRATASRRGWHRRPESASERERELLRPRVRRTGHGSRSPFRKGPAPGVAFLCPDLPSPGSGRGRDPVGAPPLSPTQEGANARGRPPAGPEVGVDAASGLGGPGAGAALGGSKGDAIERACPPDARAALDGLRQRLAGEGGRAERLAALRAGAVGVPIVAVALAGWEAALPGVEPRLSRRWAGRLERAGGQLDRLWGPGAAATQLLDRLADLGPNAHDLAPGAGLAEVHTLAYFAAELRARARAEVRADRHRRGRRTSPAPRPHKPRGRL